MGEPTITPDTVRALIADTEPRAPLLPDGTMPVDSDGNCTACGWKTAAYVPDGPDHGPGCPADREYWRLVGARAATRSAAPAIALAYLAVCAERDRLREIADARGLIRREIKAALGAPDDQAPMVQIAARVAAERDRLARVLDNPGDYVQTWKPTYNELVGIAHAQTVTVTVPSVVIRDHLRARLEGDRAGGSDV